MRAVVLQHEAHEGLDVLEGVLKATGYAVTTHFRSVQHRDLEADLVVVLGGSMSVAAVDQHPFLRDELGFLTERFALGLPMLGVCLGAQLLATAAGATVSRGKNGFEVGVAPVRWSKDALGDLAAGMPAKSVMAHWHEDTWSPVPGATLLASTERYSQQGFRVGKTIGLQFHPELRAETFREWLERDRELLELDGKNVEELISALPKLKAVEESNRLFLERVVHALR